MTNTFFAVPVVRKSSFRSVILSESRVICESTSSCQAFIASSRGEGVVRVPGVSLEGAAESVMGDWGCHAEMGFAGRASSVVASSLRDWMYAYNSGFVEGRSWVLRMCRSESREVISMCLEAISLCMWVGGRMMDLGEVV
jgi:hypothetical protein